MTDEAHFPRRLHTLHPLPDGSPRGAYDQDGHWVLPGPQTIGGECIYNREAFQARLIASYNACEGIPVEALEADMVKDMVGALWGARWAWKRIEAVLATLTTGAQP